MRQALSVPINVVRNQAFDGRNAKDLHECRCFGKQTEDNINFWVRGMPRRLGSFGPRRSCLAGWHGRREDIFHERF